MGNCGAVTTAGHAHDVHRVLLAIGSLDVGGAEKQIVSLALSLKALGCDVSLVLLTGGREREAMLRGHGIEVFPLLHNAERPQSPTALIRAIPKAMYRAFMFMRNFEPQVVHAWLFHAYVLLLPLAWLLRVPVRIQGRRSMRAGMRQSALVRNALWFVSHFTTGFTVNARAIQVELESTEHVDAQHICYIPNSIPLSVLCADVTRQPARGVLVARFVPDKAHELLLRALQLLSERPQMVLVGDGPRLEEMRALAHELGVADSVTFAGSCTDATAYQLDAQFAVLCSRTEGLPNVVLEAMALGLPTVATNVGGVGELLEHEGTGLLVPPDDTAALAAAIERMASSPELRLRMGSAARARVRGFSDETIAQAFLAFYEQQLKARTRDEAGDVS